MNPSASHFAFGKRQVRERFVSEGARAFHVAYLYSNLLGNESGRIIFDGGALIATDGKLVGRGSRFSYKDYVLTRAVVDIDHNRMTRARTGSYQPLIGDEGGIKVEVPFAWPVVKDPVSIESLPAEAWEGSTDLKAEEFCRAVALGLFDFLRKGRLHGFTVSISGGVDSAAVTAICSLALRFAAGELGLSGLKERLGYVSQLHGMHDLPAITRHLIHCAYQATENSGKETAAAARAVAGAVNASYYEWSVQRVLSDYVKLISDGTGINLNWNDHDIVLQNIQARARGPSIWMLANLKNHLLLATSNRSEAAVGYATMDGDTCGGLSPIAGIDKAYLRRWLVWLERVGPAGLGPVPELALVNQNPPTAELRPRDRQQTDESDLMPYDVLDVIERAAIRDKKSPQDVLDTLASLFPDSSDDARERWVRKFFTLWCRNQWKRERYAPGFHLDDESLDPKTWCRFPVLSGNFEEELSALGSGT
jgi:NAD+ synthase (glutamine-hydrolysing)